MSTRSELGDIFKQGFKGVLVDTVPSRWRGGFDGGNVDNQ